VGEVAERIIRTIGATPIQVDGHSVTITASGGLVYVEPGMSLPAILRFADQAAYEAKTLGKNMLVVFAKSAFRKATEDPLTGLYNQGYFEQKLLVEIKHAEEYQTLLTIALCDLDHFGKINKRIGFGMPAGNSALKRFAEIATGCIRSTDWIARCGGDEFCLVMPGTTLETGAAVAERVRAAVACTDLQSPSEERFSITVSIGVVQWTSACGGPDKLMQKASDAVIAAKSEGGNRVIAMHCEGKQ
jgi:diguanylate cyclase (GGDEF)-like protein